MIFQSKIPNTKPHIFSHMSGLASQFSAINLAQGFPDFEPSDELKKHLISCMNNTSQPLIHQYAPIAGNLTLRSKIADQHLERHGVLADPEEEITIGVGATELIFDAITAFVWPGDEVIIIEPGYDCYKPAIELMLGKVVISTMKPPEFGVCWEDFKKLITPKTKMICINSPNNPSGVTFKKEDYQELIQITKDKDIIILSDEVYEHMVYDGASHISPQSFPDLRKKTISIFSLGKTYHTTGWRIGHCIAPKKITEEIRKVHQNNVFSVAHPLQKALALYMSHSDEYKTLPSFFQNKRNLLVNEMKGSGLKPLPCQGAYFQLYDYSNISNENDFQFCTRLVKEFGVAALPVSRLYSDEKDNRLIRLCFAKKDETLIEAGKRLKHL